LGFKPSDLLRDGNPGKLLEGCPHCGKSGRLTGPATTPGLKKREKLNFLKENVTYKFPRIA
jgi:hypothetical protein